jgi:hypothetical protein
MGTREKLIKARLAMLPPAVRGAWLLSSALGSFFRSE